MDSDNAPATEAAEVDLFPPNGAADQPKVRETLRTYFIIVAVFVGMQFLGVAISAPEMMLTTTDMWASSIFYRLLFTAMTVYACGGVLMYMLGAARVAGPGDGLFTPGEIGAFTAIYAVHALWQLVAFVNTLLDLINCGTLAYCWIAPGATNPALWGLMFVHIFGMLSGIIAVFARRVIISNHALVLKTGAYYVGESMLVGDARDTGTADDSYEEIARKLKV